MNSLNGSSLNGSVDVQKIIFFEDKTFYTKTPYLSLPSTSLIAVAENIDRWKSNDFYIRDGLTLLIIRKYIEIADPQFLIVCKGGHIYTPQGSLISRLVLDVNGTAADLELSPLPHPLFPDSSVN